MILFLRKNNKNVADVEYWQESDRSLRCKVVIPVRMYTEVLHDQPFQKLGSFVDVFEKIQRFPQWLWHQHETNQLPDGNDGIYTNAYYTALDRFRRVMNDAAEAFELEYVED